LTEDSQWRRCSACKKPIEFGSVYWVCNVSTCNRKRTALAFCSVDCWEVHLPTANHREAWAVERTAPATAELATHPADSKEPKAGRRKLIRSSSTQSAPAEPKEVLIVASRLKDFIRDRSGFNTSDRVLEPLSEIVRRVCLEAIETAARDGRRTVLDRDIPRS
jgi:hypothetical protein